MIYCATPVVNKIDADGFTTVIQVPTFYLNGYIQGIVSVEHAEEIVRSVCNPAKDPTVTVHPNVFPIHPGEVLNMFGS